MSERQTQVVTYAPLESGDAESRWIRLRQVGRQDESISMSEAAEIIDELYGVRPCETGMGGGGKEADEEPPDEDAFKVAMSEMFHRAGMCFEESYWVADVDVLRSHRQPGYELRTTGADVERVRPIRESVREVVEVSGAVIELSMPYDGGLTGIPAGVKWEVRGSTVNLDRPVYARMTLRYNTYYERVTLHTQTDFEGKDDPVRRAAAEYAPGDIYAVAGYKGQNNTHYRPELPEAGLIAFWGDLAASCELLNPNGQDDSVDIFEIQNECNPQKSGGEGEIEEPCTGFVHHYMLCNCSRKRVDGAITTELIECPKCTGLTPEICEKRYHRDQFDGFTWCEGEEDELSTVEYYLRVCCRRPAGGGLPRCRRSYALYRGGREIESGPDHWRNIYGADVEMVAVLPEDGICGEEITEWEVPRKNCCDDVKPMTPEPDNPRIIRIGGAVRLCVDGGNYEKTWRTSGGLYMHGGQTVITAGGDCMVVVADDDACDNGVVQVDDGCSRVAMPLSLEIPGEAMYLEPEHVMLASGGLLTVHAANARGKVQWSAGGGLKMLTAQGEQSALFEAPDNFCGLADVTASDACMQIASMTAQGTAGRWVEVSGFDPCSPPWGGAPSAIGWSAEWGYMVEAQGWRGYVQSITGSKSMPKSGACPHNGSCEEAIEAYTGSPPPCGYSGREMVRSYNGSSIWVNCQPSDKRTCYPLCYNVYECIRRSPPRTDYETENTWAASVQYVSRLLRWECEDEE